MVMTTEAKVLAALESISATQLRITDSLSELVTVAKELVKVNSKRQGSKDTKETFAAFLEDAKTMLKPLTTPQPFPYFEPPQVKHEIKVLYIGDYVHSKAKLEEDFNRLASDNWILAGVSDSVIILHKSTIIPKTVDAEFVDDGGKVDVQ